MHLRRAVGEYVAQGRELLEQLRSSEEGPTLLPLDLHILRVQLFLLDHQVANMQRKHEATKAQLNRGSRTRLKDQVN